jgi:diguanylate cyclase (GGDEF)-like protein
MNVRAKTSTSGRNPARWQFGEVVDRLGPSIFVGLLMPDGTLIHANRAALDAIEMPLKEVTGLPFEETPWWRDSPAARSRLRDALHAAANGASSRFEADLEISPTKHLTIDFSLHPVVDDFGKPALLVPSACDVSDRRAAEWRAAFLEENDRLTALPNQHYLHRALDTELRRRADLGQELAVLWIDLDRIGRLKAAFGSEAGDEALRHASRQLASCLRAEDLLIRMDGFEFVVLLGPKASPAATATQVAARLKAALSEPFTVAGSEVSLTASIGIARADGGSGAAHGAALMRNAAVALERAKAADRDMHMTYSRDRPVVDREALLIESSLRRAIERHELSLAYQPQVDIASGAIVGAEALLRWNHPILGNVGPARFIPIAEETGQIDAIGRWVIQTACETAGTWQRAKLPPVRLWVNVSACQLCQSDLADQIEAALLGNALDAARFGIELTEAVLIKGDGPAIAQLERLHALGVAISLDDFGTGYSSLSYLSRMPIDVVKIDCSLVPATPGDTKAMAIAAAIVAMAHGLGIKALAEGVESERQLELMASISCDLFQGYHCSPAVPAETFVRMLSSPGPACPGFAHGTLPWRTTAIGPGHEMFLPTSLLTLPGDLWVPRSEQDEG